MTISEKMLRIIKKIIFSQRVWKGTNPELRFWFDEKDFFCSNQWNWTNINENSFPPQNELLSTKLSISGILKHFCWILTKSFSMRYKTWLSQDIVKNYPDFSIFSMGLKGVTLRKGSDLMETNFLVKPVKRDKYIRKQLCSSKWSTYS